MMKFPPASWKDLSISCIEMIPSLEDHRCSEGVKGGLIMRMREGTLLGHVIEHIALELQYIAYMDVGFGKTIDADAPRTFNVIFSYWVEEAGIYAGMEAVEIVNSLLSGKRMTSKDHIRAERYSGRSLPGPLHRIHRSGSGASRHHRASAG
jgi:hypothetical protein